MVIASVPQISISLAPPEDLFVEPTSPFPWNPAPDKDEDGFRPTHLTPPPTHIHFPKPLSPLRAVAPAGNGLEQERFEALLKATKERNMAVGSKKTNDLRKEIALKAHKTKQVERRALFLSKVLAPPSPTATSLPKTPPESPAIFHYSLPSPGLVSPLALFETLGSGSDVYDAPKAWVEQVDFRLPSGKIKPVHHKATVVERQSAATKRLPSLEQISARLTRPGQIHNHNERVRRLPAFLTLRPGVESSEVKHVSQNRLNVAPPKSPCYPLSPQLEVTTVLVPRTATTSPAMLSESNLQAFDLRERRASNMLSTIRRRTMLSDAGVNGHTEDYEERRSRRHSAPADLSPYKPRSGFEHHILSTPGAF